METTKISNNSQSGNDSLQTFIDGGANLEKVQQRILRDVLKRNVKCVYGRSHGFNAVDGAESYKLLPYMRYENVSCVGDFWSDAANFCCERLAAYFLTSGSSAQPKKIPVTSNLIREKSRAFAIFWNSIYRDHPNLKTGNFIANFADSGTSRRNSNNILEISETAFWNQRMQGFQDPDRWPLGRHLTSIRDAELRYYAAVRLALQGKLHCFMSLNPSTLVKFCRTLQDNIPQLCDGLVSNSWGLPELDNATDLPAALTSRLRPNSDVAAVLSGLARAGDEPLQLRSIWPELELVICWQSDLVEPYLRLLRPYLSGVNFRDYITQSSECIIAIPVEDNLSGGLLAYTSHYFEFIAEEQFESENPTSLAAWEIEAGKKYEVVVTTGGGLYRYRTADCIRVTGFENHIPRLDFQYRLGRTSSITGEKLTEQQVLLALKMSDGDSVVDLSRVMVFPRTGERPHYAVMAPESALRGADTQGAIQAWMARLETALGEVNGEYSDKRETLRLGDLCMIVVELQGYTELQNRFRAAHVGDEQFKPGVLRKERDLDKDVVHIGEFRANN